MGMFDYLRCEYPLPGTQLEFIEEFQTKDFGRTLSVISIDSDGNLDRNYTGQVNFYGSNTVASNHAGVYTTNGEDSEWAEYKATFIDGKLTNIKQISYERQPALSVSEMKERQRLESELNRDDSFVGKKIFQLWGQQSLSEGQYVDVIAESPRELCIRKSDGSLELTQRFGIGSILFKDKDEAQRIRDFDENEMQKEKLEYESKISAKIVRN